MKVSLSQINDFSSIFLKLNILPVTHAVTLLLRWSSSLLFVVRDNISLRISMAAVGQARITIKDNYRVIG